MHTHPRHSAIVAALVAGVALVAVTGGTVFRKQLVEQREQEQALATGRAATTQAAQAIETAIQPIPARVLAIRDELEAGRLQPDQVQARLAMALDSDEVVTGYGVAFERDILEGRALFAPYLERSTVRGEAPLDTDLGELYDYTDYRYLWYRNTVLDGGGWMQANLFPDTGDHVVLYASPFVLPIGGQRASGVVFAVVALDTLDRTLGGGGLGSNGYAFLVSSDGQYLAHPQQELVHDQGTLFATAWTTGNADLNTLAVQASRGEPGFEETLDDASGRITWTFVEPVPSSRWSVFTILFGDQFGPDSDWERHQFFLIITFALIGLSLLAFAASAWWIKNEERHLWATAVALTLIVSSGVVAMWVVAYRFPPALDEVQSVVLDQGAAHQYLADAGIEATRTLVPTGVLVRSINIDSGSEVSVAGYIWQRFELGRQDSVPRGFMLPETFDPERSFISEVFKERVDGEERIAWEFKATFRQQFDYTKFPFDRQSVWVRLRPASPVSTVVLVPDYGGYAMMNPVFRPGVDAGLIVSGWDVLSSYFDYRQHTYNSTLGMAGRESTASYPEMYFNVEMRRRFLGPFVSQVVPLVVTAAMLFSLLLISSRREASQGLLGFSAAEVVLGAAALFFVASFQHGALRDMLGADNIVYFEYLYFGLYLLIMLVSVNAILFASSLDVEFVEHGDNLIPKLAFWPVCVVTLFALTTAQFY
jgi:hypothetical protein